MPLQIIDGTRRYYCLLTGRQYVNALDLAGAFIALCLMDAVIKARWNSDVHSPALQ